MKIFLHPEYSSEVFIKSAGTLTLGTVRGEFTGLMLHVLSKYELIRMTSTEGAGTAVDLSANGPDFPDLFMHCLILQ